MKRAITSITLITAAALSAGLLAGCDPATEEKTAGQKLDQMIGQTRQAANEVKADAKEVLNTGEASARDSAQAVKDKVAEVGTGIARGVEDAAISAAVAAELAKDPELSVLKIKVSTERGRVVLEGTAPSTGARDRATSIAMATKGVTGVANNLSVKAG